MTYDDLRDAVADAERNARAMGQSSGHAADAALAVVADALRGQAAAGPDPCVLMCGECEVCTHFQMWWSCYTAMLAVVTPPEVTK